MWMLHARRMQSILLQAISKETFKAIWHDAFTCNATSPIPRFLHGPNPASFCSFNMINIAQIWLLMIKAYMVCLGLEPGAYEYTELWRQPKRFII